METGKDVIKDGRTEAHHHAGLTGSHRTGKPWGWRSGLCLPRPTPSPHFCQKKWPTSQGTDFFRSFSKTCVGPDEQKV